jgi:cysteinyl-tRNA synthetase
MDALFDDLNTPKAIGEMHQLADKARKGDFEAAQGLHQSGNFFGIFSHGLKSWKDFAEIGRAAGELMPKEFRDAVNSLIDARTAARKAKDFKKSDRIRDELTKMGVVLKDSKDGTTWEIAR